MPYRPCPLGGQAVVLGPPVNRRQAMLDRLDLGFSKDIMADRDDRWPILASVRHKGTDTRSARCNDARTDPAVLVLIGELYDIDKRANDKPLDERHAHRQQHVAPHVDRMRAWLEAHAAFGLGHGGLLTTAFTYLYNQWEKLVRFLEDPRLRQDNNLAERHTRPVALGRRTWVFCRSRAGARASAGWYSVVETAKANGLEPSWYLRCVFEQMPLYLKEGRAVEPLLAWNLSAEQIIPSADRG
jgi:transposase